MIFQAAVFLFEKVEYGGVISAPFFKDTAVSEEVSPCPFYFSIAFMICTS